MTVPENTVHYLEIVTNDVAAMRASYEKLFGWSFVRMGPELGHSYVAELPNGSRCGIRAPMHEQEKPIVRAYIRVADVARAAKEAESRGAFVALPPMEIPGHGTIAIYMMGGIEQGIWQVA